MEHGYYDNTPQAEFTVSLTVEEYKKARVQISRRFGRLRNAPFFILLGAALMVLGVSGLFYQITSIAAVILMAVLVGIGGILIFLYASYYPTFAAERAQQVFESSRRASLPYKVKLYRDTFEVTDEYGSRIGYYSEQSACLETDDLIVFYLSSDQSPIVLPKRCFGANGQEIVELLRFTFGKRYLK